jgi:hypothetical protein
MTNELRDALTDLVDDVEPPVGLGEQALKSSNRIRVRRGLLGAGVAAVAAVAVVGGVAAWPVNHTIVRPAAPPEKKAPAVKTAKIGEKVPIGDPSKPGGAYAWIIMEGGKPVFHFKVTGCPKDDPNREDRGGAVSQKEIEAGFSPPIMCVAPGANTVPIGFVNPRPEKGWGFSGRTKAPLTATRIGNYTLLTAIMKRTACMAPMISIPMLQSDALGYPGVRTGCSNIVDPSVPFEYGEKWDLGSGAQVWTTRAAGKVTINATAPGQTRVLSSQPLGDVAAAGGKLAFCTAGSKTVYVAAVVPPLVQKFLLAYGEPVLNFDRVNLGEGYLMVATALPSSVPCAATGMPPLNFVIIKTTEMRVEVPIQVLQS